MSTVTLAGYTFTAAQFEDRGYIDTITINGVEYQRFLGLFAAAMADFGLAVKTTASAISINVANASTHTITLGTDRPFTIGGFVMVTDDTVASRFMFCQVNAYDPSTKALTVSTVVAGGTGTIVNANVQIAGARGAPGAGAPTPSGADALKLVRANAGGTDLEFASAGAASLFAYGKYAVPVNANAIVPTATDGCSNPTVREGGGSAATPYVTVDFDTAVAESGLFAFIPPKSVDKATSIEIHNFIWSHTETLASAGVAGIAFSFQARSAHGLWNQDFGASVVVTDTGITGNVSRVAATAVGMVPGGTFANAEELVMKITRQVTNASDTLPGDVRIHGFQLVFQFEGDDT